jgi:hypothetical protein
MQVSYFETGRYYAPSNLPREWPMPAGAYDREAGLRAFRGMVERSRYVEELGFDWVSVSEHHYSPRILTPSLPIAAAYIASHVHNIKIALLGPIVPQSNPVLLAEEMAMLEYDGRGPAAGAARVGMRGGEVKVQRATEGGACLDAGQSARASLSVPARARFDRLLLPLGTICRCPSRSEARSYPRNRRESGECRFN